MFVHVVAEVAEESNLLVEGRGIVLQLVVVFHVVPLNVVNVPEEAKHMTNNVRKGSSFAAL